ncbi:hypothetical protein ACSSS7_006410 [Eimeria intestinalis]
MGVSAATKPQTHHAERLQLLEYQQQQQQQQQQEQNNTGMRRVGGDDLEKHDSALRCMDTSGKNVEAALKLLHAISSNSSSSSSAVAATS